VKPGDVVRVMESELSNPNHKRLLANHGWLWVVVGEYRNGTTGYGEGCWFCKSLATGASTYGRGRKIWFFENELEQANEE
jgi:hypothetical protein